MSQYKDLITGEVLFNARIINDKVIDLSSTSTKATVYYTVTNTISISSTQSKFSNKSLYFGDKTNGSSIIEKNLNTTVPGDFTFSSWIYLPTRSDINALDCFMEFALLWPKTSYIPEIEAMPIISSNDSGSIGKIGRLVAYPNYQQSHTRLSQPAAVSFDSWHHFAVVRSGQYVRMFVDGVQVATENNMLESSWTQGNVTARFINYANNAGAYPVYIDDFVFINGQALWTENFDVPTNYITGDYTGSIKHNQIIYPELNIPTITGDILFDIRVVGKHLYNKAPTKVKAISNNNKFQFVNFANSINSDMVCRSNVINDYYWLQDSIYLGEKFTYTFWGYCPTPKSSIPDSSEYPLFLTALRSQTSQSIFLTPLWNRKQYAVATREATVLTYDMSSNYDKWNYFTITRDGNNLYVFINGNLINSVNISSYDLSSFQIANLNIYDGYTSMTWLPGYDLSYNFYIDDIVFINNQCLWTNDFDVPVTYLTDELEVFKKSGILYAQYNSLYFDKVYLY